MPTSALFLSGSFNNWNLKLVSVGTSVTVNVPSNGVVITSMKDRGPTGDASPSLDGSK